MPMNMNSLYISGIDTRYNANMIADILFQQGVATVSRITILPEDKMDAVAMNTNIQYVKVYVEIRLWHDTERANMIMHCLNNSLVVSLYDQENVWEVKLNNRPNICYYKRNQDYTTIYESYVTDVFMPNPSMPMTIPMMQPTYMMPNPTPMMYPIIYPNYMYNPYPIVPNYMTY